MWSKCLQELTGVPMTNKFGQKYFCSLPKSTSGDDDKSDADGDAKTPPNVVHGPDNIPELLAPMAKDPCLAKTKDWWTYEVCFKKIAKQYHVEGQPQLSKTLHRLFETYFCRKNC
jgi:hypothetical protein